MKNVNMMVLALIICTMPFIAGCLGSGGVNPVADSSIAQSNSQELIAAADIEDPQILAARFSAPVTKKYTFADPAHSVSHRYRAGLAKLPGSLRLGFLAPATADHIFITVSQIQVKNAQGKTTKLGLNSKEIDLLSATSVSSVLADANLPAGTYKHLSFRIDSGRVEKGGVFTPLFTPFKDVKFVGSFEIKDGYRTEVTIKMTHKLHKVWTPSRGYTYSLSPVIKISSKLVEVAPSLPAVTDGDISGVVTDFVKKTPLVGVTVALSGTSLSATSAADGKFSFAKVPQGNYTLTLAHPDYLNKSFAVTVVAAKVADVAAEMNPAVIKSTLANTGWFSYDFPFADASGEYAEMSMETPVVIDFASLNFVKVEMKFDAEYFVNAEGIFSSYLSTTKQVQVLQDLQTWWVGNSAALGSFLGEFRSAAPALSYTLDVTEFVRNNPNAMYFMATRNLSTANMRLMNVQMTIFYR